MGCKFEISRESVIVDILREYPECISVFDKYGMPCRTCMGASTDTLGEGAMMHDVDADQLIADLKQCCSRPEQGTQPL